MRFTLPEAAQAAGEARDMVSECCSPLPILEVSSVRTGVGIGGSALWPVNVYLFVLTIRVPVKAPLVPHMGVISISKSVPCPGASVRGVD